MVWMLFLFVVTPTAATTASTTTASVLGSTGPTLLASIASSSALTSSTTTGLSRKTQCTDFICWGNKHAAQLVLPVSSAAADVGVIWENSKGQLFSLFATFPLCDFWQVAFSGEAGRVLFKTRIE